MDEYRVEFYLRFGRLGEYRQTISHGASCLWLVLLLLFCFAQNFSRHLPSSVSSNCLPSACRAHRPCSSSHLHGAARRHRTHCHHQPRPDRPLVVALTGRQCSCACPVLVAWLPSVQSCC